MRGLSWNLPKDGLRAVLRLKKAAEKEYILSEYKDTNCKYIYKKLLDPGGKRNTKGYYYALANELYGIIQLYEIYMDETKFDRVRRKQLDFFAQKIPELKAEIERKKQIQIETDKYFEEHPEELLPDSLR